MKDSICFRRKSSINNAAYRALRLDSLTSTIIEGSVKRHNAIIFLEYRLRSLYGDYIAPYECRARSQCRFRKELETGSEWRILSLIHLDVPGIRSNFFPHSL